MRGGRPVCGKCDGVCPGNEDHLLDCSGRIEMLVNCTITHIAMYMNTYTVTKLTTVGSLLGLLSELQPETMLSRALDHRMV